MQSYLNVVPCPLCNQAESFIEIDVPDTDQHIHKYKDLYAGKSKSEWKICGKCGFVHQNPRPSIESLNGFYSQSQYHTRIANNDADKYMKFARWYYGEKIDYVLNHIQNSQGRVFDIGCGQGGVLKLYEERGWKTYGVEPDKVLANFAINDLDLKGVKQGILDSHFAQEDKVDLVVSNHAFEHFADLDEVMQGVQNLLKVNGHIFIVIPTYFKNKSSMSKRWMNSAHYSLFTHNSLNNLLCRYGFDEVDHTYNGWYKEIDELWYLARYTGKKGDPAIFFEKPETVSRYLHVLNPLRTIVFFPIYSNWPTRVRFFSLTNYAVKLFFSSPQVFFRKLILRIVKVFKA